MEKKKGMEEVICCLSKASKEGGLFLCGNEWRATSAEQGFKKSPLSVL